jgi:hypothetical protein
MKKKIIGIFVCMLFLLSAIPTIQGVNTEDKIDDGSCIMILILKGNRFRDGLEEHMGFRVEVFNPSQEYTTVNISIVINVYDVHWEHLSTEFYNSTKNLGENRGFGHHFLLQNNSLISFVRVDVVANEKKLSKTGLSIGQFVLFFIRNFK